MKSKWKIVFLICAGLFINKVIRSQNFPTGFSQVRIATIEDGTAMDFAPDGRLFVGQKNGAVRIIKNGSLLSTPFLTLNVDQNGERGISGLTFDPNFNSNHYVYIYYTAVSPTIHNRLSRFTANGDVVVQGSEFILLDAEPVTSVYHNGGGMDFGPDGKLYLAMGEDNKPNNAQNLTNYKGKLLRINKDGSAPTDNPYSSSSSSITKKIWCLGLRNPYTISFQPGTGKLFVNNVGADNWEEVHDGTTAGKNFGWPIVEGSSNDPTYANPVFSYPHDASGQHGCAITGGTFFNPTSTNYPSTYNGKYFYMDFCNGWMYYLTLGSTVTNTFFASGLTTKNLALQVGPDGNLYYINRDESKRGIYKIIYSNNNAPVITSQPSSQTITAGQSVTFNASASGALPLNYQWRKNGVNINGATGTSYTITNIQPSHAGQYSVKVTNNFGSATSNNANLTVTAFNASPQATITTPTNGARFRAGDVINFSGNATDAEDGILPASAFKWTVEFWHNNNHFHPGAVIPSGIKNGSFTTSNTDHTSANIFYRLKLKVTDSNGLIDTAYVDILPITSTITINSQPPGLEITFDSQPKPTSFSTLTVEGLYISIGAVSPQTKNGQAYAFDHWEHGGSMNQTIKIGEGDSSYTAVFKDTVVSCSAAGTITREVWENVPSRSLSDVPFNSSPSSVSQRTIFEGPSHVADNYGSRIRGYICPPATGNYIFWIASDNSSELWLSTNDQSSNKVKIASVSGYTSVREWTKYPSQQSTPVNLTAGMKYYIEAIHRENTQGDNLAVGWQLPNGTMERPIPGNRLSPYQQNNPPVVTITSPANNLKYSTPANITIKAEASGGEITKVEFFQGNTKIGEDATTPYSFTWMNVTTGNYALKAIARTNNGQSGTSQIINVIVTNCTTPVITPQGPTTVCSGNVTLKTNTGSGFAYQWKKNGTDIPGATGATYTASTSGDYQVKVIQGSCMSWSAPITIKIQNGLSASITPGGPTTFCSGGKVVLYANTCSGYSYQWKKNGTDIPGATGATYTATSTGNYQLKVTQAGQNAWSSQLNVTVNNCKSFDADEDTINSEQSVPGPELSVSDLPEEISNFQMKVYPNPNNGLFTIIINMPTSKEEKVKVRMVNLLGQEIYNKEFVANSDYIKEIVELDNSIQTGVYTLQVMIGNNVESMSVVLSK